MTRTIYLDEKHRLRFYYDLRSHIWLYVRLAFLDSNGNMRQFSDMDDSSKNFIFDTGAQNTIISKRRAIECGYTNLPIQESVSAGGIGGGFLSCLRIEIPYMIIANKLIIHRPSVLILEDINTNINILGQDILKPYSYYLDAKRQLIYFDLDNE